MAFDPTKPVENSPLDAAEMRNQFNGLKALIDAQAAQIVDLQTQLANKAILPTAQPYDQSISNPPTQADIQNLVDWLNNMLGELEGAP